MDQEDPQKAEAQTVRRLEPSMHAAGLGEAGSVRARWGVPGGEEHVACKSKAEQWSY